MADDAALLEALRDVVDPELMINIVDLGLIYDVEQVDNKVTVNMTLTSPACPAGPQIIQQAKMALEKLAGRLRGRDQAGDEPALVARPHDRRAARPTGDSLIARVHFFFSRLRTLIKERHAVDPDLAVRLFWRTQYLQDGVRTGERKAF